MIRFLFFCLAAYLLFRLYSFIRRIGRTSPPSPPAASSGAMVKDEVCQTYLPREKAIREIIDGREQFFCSPECRRKCLEERKKAR